ncbi:MAG: DUF2283 domain-containing protein [Mycobacterium sp.]|nr:DUF2283 domain-containing protein [Mycobacterium sp.]
MRITYDPDADAATIYFVDEIRSGGAPKSMMCDLEMREAAVILLLDDNDVIVGVEVLGARKLLPEALLRDATQPPTGE